MILTRQTIIMHRTPAGVLICNNWPIYYTCKQGQIRTTKRIFCILLRTNKDYKTNFLHPAKDEYGLKNEFSASC